MKNKIILGIFSTTIIFSILIVHQLYFQHNKIGSLQTSTIDFACNEQFGEKYIVVEKTFKCTNSLTYQALKIENFDKYCFSQFADPIEKKRVLLLQLSRQ